MMFGRMRPRQASAASHSPADAKEARAAAAPTEPKAFHPILFALFPLCSLYAANISLVPWIDTLRAYVAVLSAALLLWGVLRLGLRPAGRAAALTSAWTLLFFAYGHLNALPALHDWLATQVYIFFPGGADIDPRAVSLPIWFLLVAGVTVALLRIRADRFSTLTPILNVVSIVQILPSLLTMAASPSRHAGLLPLLHRRQFEAKAAPAQRPSAAAPDIYYIILDAYGREDVLRYFYGYDNQPFLDALRQRGFFVADRARANYDVTICALAASLNMNYLPAALPPGKYAGNDSAPFSRSIDHNAVAKFLRARGYEFIDISTAYPPTATPSADRVYGLGGVTSQVLNSYEGTLFNLTPLSAFAQTQDRLFNDHRQEILNGFASLSAVSRLPERKFVFAHILIPHPPFVFNADGSAPQVGRHAVYSLNDGSDYFAVHRSPDAQAQYRAQYIGQLQFANRRLLQAIDAIRAQSNVPPVILVQGDHGPRMHLDWNSLGASDVREVFGNLNALYLPDNKAAQVFPPDLSPVNSFRLLFNHYFDAGFPLLPNRSYYSNSEQRYRFIDVTNRTALPSAPP